MRNRCKTLLRDHSVPEVTLKVCPKHYPVPAIPETLTVQGPKRPPMTHRVENLTSEVSVPQEDNRYFSFNLFWLKLALNRGIYWLKTGVKSWNILVKNWR